MTIVYVTTGAWGTGSGTPNSAAQVDGNFYDLDQRIVNLIGDVSGGKLIDHVVYSSNSITFYYTDATSQVIPLPVATMQYVGTWTNSTPYVRGQLFIANNGFYQVLLDHVSPAYPAPFDPNATSGGNPLYQLWMPVRDVNYDAAIFVPGSIQRAAADLLFKGVANRPMNLAAGNAFAYAHLGVGNDAGGATNIILSIEKNGTEIGTITFAAGGGQNGVFSIPTATNFAAGDRYALRVTQSNNVAPADLSVTLPFVRTDI